MHMSDARVTNFSCTTHCTNCANLDTNGAGSMDCSSKQDHRGMGSLGSCTSPLMLPTLRRALLCNGCLPVWAVCTPPTSNRLLLVDGALPYSGNPSHISSSSGLFSDTLRRFTCVLTKATRSTSRCRSCMSFLKVSSPISFLSLSSNLQRTS